MGQVHNRKISARAALQPGIVVVAIATKYYSVEEMAARLITRGVASNRQVKKLQFVRRRAPAPDPATTPEALERAAAAAALPWNVKRREVEALANGWTPPPEAPPADVPFGVRRSAGGFLPVYPKLRANRPPATVLRHVSGDLDALEAGLAGVAPGAAVTRRLGTVEVRGDNARAIRDWLAGLGL